MGAFRRWPSLSIIAFGLVPDAILILVCEAVEAGRRIVIVPIVESVINKTDQTLPSGRWFVGAPIEFVRCGREVPHLSFLQHGLCFWTHA